MHIEQSRALSDLITFQDDLLQPDVFSQRLQCAHWVNTSSEEPIFIILWPCRGSVSLSVWAWCPEATLLEHTAARTHAFWANPSLNDGDKLKLLTLTEKKTKKQQPDSIINVRRCLLDTDRMEGGGVGRGGCIFISLIIQNWCHFKLNGSGANGSRLCSSVAFLAQPLPAGGRAGRLHHQLGQIERVNMQNGKEMKRMQLSLLDTRLKLATLTWLALIRSLLCRTGGFVCENRTIVCLVAAVYWVSLFDTLF